jgi:hypothetical protein
VGAVVALTILMVLGVTTTAYALCLYDASGTALWARFPVPVRVSIPYAETGGFVDGAKTAVPENLLSMYYLDEEHALWVRIPESTVDDADNVVTALVTHFSVFGLFGTPGAPSATDVYAFPVPFRRDVDTAITFVGLPLDAVILSSTIARDKEMLQNVERCDAEGFYAYIAAERDSRHVCGLPPIYAMTKALGEREGRLLDHCHWFDQQEGSAVTFAAMVFPR